MDYIVKVVRGHTRIEYIDDTAASSCGAVDRAINLFGHCNSVVAKAIFTEESSAKFLPERAAAAELLARLSPGNQQTTLSRGTLP